MYSDIHIDGDQLKWCIFVNEKIVPIHWPYLNKLKGVHESIHMHFFFFFRCEHQKRRTAIVTPHQFYSLQNKSYCVFSYSFAGGYIYMAEHFLQVIISLKAVRARLHNAREEREQFDEASNQILVHIKSKVL